MNINSNSTVNFGQMVPTEPLLKSAVKIHKYEDAKALNYALGIKVSGHISFYKRAVAIAEKVVRNNPEIKKMVDKIKSFSNSDEKIQEIQRLKDKYGENIDVVVG